MPLLIDSSGPLADDWLRLDDAMPPRGARVIVGLERLKREWREISASDFAIGVELEPDDSVDEILPFVARLGIVVLRFGKFADGRAFSQASLLRNRHGYGGIIRARGEVLRDQLAFMQRCGFDQFELADGEDLASALGAFAEISLSYQPAPRASAPAAARLRRTAPSARRAPAVARAR